MTIIDYLKEVKQTKNNKVHKESEERMELIRIAQRVSQMLDSRIRASVCVLVERDPALPCTRVSLQNVVSQCYYVACIIPIEEKYNKVKVNVEVLVQKTRSVANNDTRMHVELYPRTGAIESVKGILMPVRSKKLTSDDVTEMILDQFNEKYPEALNDTQHF